ncbi:hypothetical protein F7R91_34435 [Streptomyces luteolifulvus]|jgi:predicted lipoprotein with Yx(FWY)xxD motif|uniref:Lipoprotein n=1 Tax=Streptomyces luteolifulvus TaxID=2615112 RepID=A0A6H9UQR9_9ACTN|nr:hypothetical protein [Streptomyces luteolifulvus]KAB1140842.1 hypothetical protein F7R91_34435 [Streptomyces luteolifulvus]
MFRTRAAALASVAAVGVLLLSACGGNDANDAGASASSSASGAGELSFQNGTARQNNAPANTGDLSPDAAPAVAAKKPVARKWVQLSAGRAGQLDPVVVNGAGFTLYRFDKDTADPSKSNCSGECATTWPPYLVARGGKVFLDGIDKSAIGFIERDGAFQVTIGGWPVYLFSKDTKAGDTNGQGVGGTWFGVTPDGEKAGGGQSGGGAGASVDPQASPASSATFFQGPNFADPSQGVAGPGCRNVRFSGSLQVSGALKIWDGPDCTGNVKVVSGNVQDLSAIGFGTVKSVRFLG